MLTKEEFKEVAKIMMRADHGCPYCASDLLILLGKKFPKYEEELGEIWKEEYGHIDYKRV